MRVRWLKSARENLDKALDYVAKDDPDAAAMYEHIRSRVADLARQPGQGRPGRLYGTRELVIEKYPYLIPYSVTNNDIVILRVFHTSQRPPGTW